MNCQEALSHLYEVLDKEASQVDTQEIKKHLDNCHYCLERYKIEGALHEFVVERARTMPSTERLESLRTRILTTIDQISDSQEAKAKKKPANIISLVLSVAASIVVVGGVYLLSSELYRHSELFGTLEEAHWDAYEQYELGTFAASTEPSDAIAKSLHYQVLPAVHTFQLVGGTSEVIDGVQSGHYLYSKEEEFVSVFIMSAKDFRIPEDLIKNGIERNGILLFDHNCRGCRLVYHIVGDALVITATTDRDVELLDFFPGHAII